MATNTVLEAQHGDGPVSTSSGASREAATVTFPVSGMTCASCQAHVQGALNRQPGVREAAVNLMTSSARVAYDPRTTSPAALVEAVRDTGYGAELSDPEQTVAAAQEEQDRAHVAAFRDLRRRAIVSGLAGVGD